MKKPNLSRLYEAGISVIGNVSAKQILAYLDKNPHVKLPQIARVKTPTFWEYDNVPREEFIAIFEKIADQEPARRFRVTPCYHSRFWVELDTKTTKEIKQNRRELA